MPPDRLFKRKFTRSANYDARALRSARVIQSLFRRTRTAGSSDQRQLRSIVRSHRSANPYQITPSSGRSCTFWRKAQISVPINQSSGWSGLGQFNVNWGFSLGKVYGFMGGSYVYGVTVPAVAEFQALFDYYMIRAVKMQIFFTKNTDPVSSTTGASHGMPILLICNDFDDIAETMTLDTINQRVGCRHVQFDSNNSNGITQYIKPKPNSVLVQTDISTGAQSSSNAGVVFGTQWLDFAASNIVHNGIKVFYDNQGLTTNTTLGNITFVFDIEIVCKGYR